MSLITAHSLGKTYANGANALKDFSLDVASGEVVGLLGRSGAGKTTLLRLFNGSLRPSVGELQILGKSLQRLPLHSLRSLRSRMASVYQNPVVLPNLSVAHNVFMGKLGKVSLGVTLRSLLYMFPSEVEEIYHLLKDLGIEDKIGVKAGELSGGQQQRVVVARALLSQPEIILADEPVASVDERTAVLIMEAFGRQAECGATVIVSLHQVDLAFRFCSRVVVLESGTVAYDGSPEGISRQFVYEGG